MILLNLAFSLQSAYAAPLILLAQTRQADETKLMPKQMLNTERRFLQHLKSGTDSPLNRQRDSLHYCSRTRELTAVVKKLSERIVALTADVHKEVVHVDKTG